MAERLDSTSLGDGKKAPYLGMEVLCALCQASVVSWLASTPITLLVEGVKSGVVEPAQGMSYARQLPDLERRAKVLAELVAYLPKQRQGEVVREILEMIQQMGNEQAQSELLIMISSYLSGPSLVESLTMARTLTHHYRLETELALIPRLPEPMKSEALQALIRMAQAMGYSAMHYKIYLQYRVSLVRVLGELSLNAAELLKETLLRDALNIAQGILEDSLKAEHYYKQAEAFIALSPFLSEPQLQEILTAAQKLQFNRYRVYAHIARYLSNPLKNEVVQQVLQALREIKHEGELSELLIALIPAIDKHLLEDVLAAVGSMQNDTYRIRVLVQLVHSGSTQSRKELLQEALKTARRVKNLRFRAQALLELIPYFTSHEKDTLVQEVLVAARAIKNKVARAETLVRVAPHIQKELQSETIQEALKIIQSIEDERYQAYAIAAFVCYAPRNLKDSLSQRAVSLVRTTREDRLRLQALIDIIVYLPESLRGEAIQEVLALVRAERDEREQLQALRSLAPLLSGYYQQEALSIAHDMSIERNKLLVLAALVCSLPEQQKSKAALEVLAAIRTIDDEKYQAQVIDHLVPYVSESVLLDALQIGRAMQYEQYQTQTLIASLPYLPVATQNQVTQEALISLRAIPQHLTDERFLIHVLKVLAPYSTEALLEEALERAWAIKHPRSQARGLSDLVLSVAEPEKNSIIRQLVTVMRTMDFEGLQTVLTALTPALLQLPSTTVYQHWRKILHGLAEHTRPDLLVGLSILAPVIFNLGGEEAIVEIIEYLSLVSHWWQ